MIRSCILVASLLLLASAAYAQVAAPQQRSRRVGENNQLAAETSDENGRSCSYIVVDGFRRQTVETYRVRPEDRCPEHNPGEDDRSLTVPSMATLAGVGPAQSDGQKMCIYEYMGRRYSRPVPMSALCPNTPHFSY